MLDLFSSLHIDGNRATSNHRGQTTSSLARHDGIVGKLTHLHACPEDYELSKVDALAGQTSAQIIQRLANGLRLGDRVARMRCRHCASVAPCCTSA